MKNQTDEELYLDLCQRDDHGAFKLLYDRHSGPLFRFVYRFTLNNQIAEEILQDIFTQLLSGKFVVGVDANLKSWLYTLAKNKSLNHLKRSSFEMSQEEVLRSVSSDQNLETEVIEKNFISRLDMAGALLPAEIQATWNLRKEGLDYQQIADRLSIPLGTVKSRFHRLVEILKKEFS